MINAIETDSDDDGRQFLSARNFRPRQYYELEDFEERFRLTRGQFQELLAQIGPFISSETDRSHALSAVDKLLATLRFYASGIFYYNVGDSHGPSKASVSRAVHLVTSVINRQLFQRVVRWPDLIGNSADRFYNFTGFPCVAGAIDGTLVTILAPHDNEEQFVDRHGSHSINAMLVCGPNLRFYYVSARWLGSVNNARVLRNSTLQERFNNGWRPFDRAILLGDSAYALKPWLMPPIAQTITEAEEAYNQAQRSTRRLIECAFGVWKASFESMRRLCVKSPVFACEVIKACAIIHNLRLPEEDGQGEQHPLRWTNFGLESEASTEDSENEEPTAIDEAERAVGLEQQNEIVTFIGERVCDRVHRRHYRR